MFEPCYMCKNIAVTREHAPPKSLFPIGYRKDLFPRIPSCKKHNIDKSDADELLKFILGTSVSSSDFANNEVFPGILRGLQEKPGKTRVLKGMRLARVYGEEVGVFDLPLEDVISLFDPVFRGLYYVHYGIAWLWKITVAIPASAYFKYSDPGNNQARLRVERISAEYFKEKPRIGNNQQVFYYQQDGADDALVMRAVFYGNFAVNAFFNPNLWRKRTGIKLW